MNEMFRCWTKKEGMLRVDEIKFENGSVRIVASDCDGGGLRNIYKLDVDNEKALRGKPFYCALLRNTGLKDKYGNEIYEGHIVKCKNLEGQLINYLIKYSDFHGRYIGYNKDQGYDLAPSKFNEAAIIGNAWENPELLPPL